MKKRILSVLTQLKIKFQKNGAGIMTYAFYKNGTPVTHSYGVLFINNDLSRVSIQEFKPVNDGEKAWNGDNGLIVSAPARNKMKAKSYRNC